MKKIKLIILFVGVALLLSTCYKEGGNAFLEKRKIYGKKYITLFTVDGIDSLKFLEDSIFKCSDIAMDFSKERNYQNEPDARGSEFHALLAYCGETRASPCQYNSWIKGRDYIAFTTLHFYSTDVCTGLEYNCKYRGLTPSPFCGNWTITKLTWKELWLEYERNNHKYIVHFKEKK